MLLELKYVEAHIEPETILLQALQEGDISVETLVRTCVDEEGANAVLEVIAADAIKEYCIDKDIYIELNHYEQTSEALKHFTTTQKAMLLWQLLGTSGETQC